MSDNNHNPHSTHLSTRMVTNRPFIIMAFSSPTSPVRLRNRSDPIPMIKAVESGGDSEAAKLHSRPLRATPHWRSLAFANPAHEASFVDASATVPARSLMTMAEEVFDRVSVAGGVLVMGLSMVLP